MKKLALIILSLIVVVIGVLALFPGIGLSAEPVWYAIVKIIIGAVGAVIGFLKD